MMAAASFISNQIRAWRVMLGASLCVVLGAKLWLVATHGSIVPFWDQWDVEAEFLYKPYLEGTLSWTTLIAQHSEHRILFTRLVALGLLTLKGTWNPLLQMSVNALVHAATIGVLICLLAASLRTATKYLFAVAAALVFAPQFGWENTLSGFQIQFYLLLLFGICSVYLSCRAPALSAFWWLSVALAVASYFNAASGVLTILASVLVSSTQIAIGQRRGWSEYLGVVVQLSLCAAMLVDIPSPPWHAEFKAQTVNQFVAAALAAASWPISDSSWPTVLSGLAALTLNAPLLVVTWRTLAQRASQSDPHWVYVSIGVWCLLQFASLAYGRTESATSSRFLDINTVGVALNFACLLHVLNELPSITRRQFVAASLWILTLTVSMGNATRTFIEQVEVKRTESQHQFQNLQNFLRSGDVAFLKDKPRGHIPYPLPERLAQFASDPTIRSLFHPGLFDPAIRSFTEVIDLRSGRLLLIVGIGLMLIVATGQLTVRRLD